MVGPTPSARARLNAPHAEPGDTERSAVAGRGACETHYNSPHTEPRRHGVVRGCRAWRVRDALQLPSHGAAETRSGSRLQGVACARRAAHFYGTAPRECSPHSRIQVRATRSIMHHAIRCTRTFHGTRRATRSHKFLRAAASPCEESLVLDPRAEPEVAHGIAVTSPKARRHRSTAAISCPSATDDWGPATSSPETRACAAPGTSRWAGCVHCG